MPVSQAWVHTGGHREGRPLQRQGGRRIQPAPGGGPQVTCQITEFGMLDRKSRWDGHLGGNWTAWPEPINERRTRRVSERTRPLEGTQMLCSLYPEELTLARTSNRSFSREDHHQHPWISVGKEVLRLPPSGHSWNYTVLAMLERSEIASNGD